MRRQLSCNRFSILRLSMGVPLKRRSLVCILRLTMISLAVEQTLILLALTPLNFQGLVFIECIRQGLPYVVLILKCASHTVQQRPVHTMRRVAYDCRSCVIMCV